MAEPPLLEVIGLSKSFFLHEQNKRIPSSAEVSLEVFPGSLTALTGPTGSGKSTVLKSIYRTYLPSGGRILYRPPGREPLDLARAEEKTIIELRQGEVRFVTQFLQYLPRQETLDVVASPLYKLGLSREQGRREARSLLKRLAIPERLWSLPPATFSGGERQRVNLARGIISKPRLLLLDEPTASLDVTTTEEVVRIIEEVKEHGTGIVAVFHEAGLVERLADRRVAVRLPEPEAACAV